MGEDTVPLQYIKMPADEHIPLHYLDTTIQDNTDLEELYLKTVDFFSSELAVEDEDEEEAENSTAGDDAPKPISENDSSEEGPKTASASDPPSTASAVTSGVVGIGAVVAAASFVV